ncbi:MAG: hypothetical protein A3G91_00370 [Omnitrophica WOR_2 bacterium RIFCSPLOWO2_12_FULL_50_9]|nr:MAG: hypothetical protein A3G91_00370 [Omnitrophica WOR_2 bacterium RIFCSPLOWO2_12_FULL_50_9]
MKRHIPKIVKAVALIIFMIGFNGAPKPALADDASSDGWSTFELMPIRTISVKGDAAKFRALNWMNDGTTGGIKAMGFDSDAGEGGQVSFDGHAIPADNDFGAGLKLTRGNGGYITMDYGNFRKWYDVYGGFYSNFTGSSSIRRLAADPKMDMGHFFFEIGSNSNILETAPGVSLSYERDTKEGIKSRLTWGTVTQTIQRKIAPSWEDVSETTDTIVLKGNTDVAGMNLSGQQRVEFSGGRSFREDDSTTSFRSYAQEPQTKQLVSSLKADRWIVDDKTYMSFGYQYHHSRNDWLETIRNYNTSGTTTSSSNNRVADAQASRDSHTAVQHFVTNLTPNLNFVTKFKEEIVAQTGTGFADGYDPGGSDRAVESENQITRTGESISLRYSGLPKTSLYTDWDFQQTRNWYSKDRIGSSHTEYLDSSPEVTGVVGVRYAPNSKFNMTSNIRRKSDHNTYNIFSNNDAALTISRLQTTFSEWSNRMTWKPAKWIENSFRVQLLDNVYRVQSLDKVGFTGNTDWIKSQGNSRIFTYNVVFQPLDEWLFDLGYSLNNFKVSTPASQTAVSGGGIPVFEADFHTWLFTGSYAPREDLSFFAGFQYTRAKDFDSQAFAGIPYGVDNEHYDANVGMKWSPKDNVTLSPHYGYYSYRADQSIDYGNYSAHVAWLDFNYDW